MTESDQAPDAQTEVLTPTQPNLLERADEIDRRHRKFIGVTATALQTLMDLGDELDATKVQVEKEVGRGKWLSWLAENTDVPERTAQLAIEFSQRKEELEQKLKRASATVADLSIREAKRILGPRPKPGHKTKKVSDGKGATQQIEHNGETETDDNDCNDNQVDNEDGVEANEDTNEVSDVDDDNASDFDGDGDDNLDGDEDDLDAKQFEALCQAYAEADELARQMFHEYLEEIYGLKVRPVRDRQQPEQMDDNSATAA